MSFPGFTTNNISRLFPRSVQNITAYPSEESAVSGKCLHDKEKKTHCIIADLSSIK